LLKLRNLIYSFVIVFFKDVGSGDSILFAPRLPDEYAVWMGKIKQLSHFKVIQTIMILICICGRIDAFTCHVMFDDAFTFCRNTIWLPRPILPTRLQLFCNSIIRVQGNPYSFFCTALTQIAIISLNLQSFRFIILNYF
jgi:hypothetical protein